MTNIFEGNTLEKDAAATFKNLGQKQENATQMAKTLEINKAWESIHASKLVYFANEIEKLTKIDFKKIINNALTEEEWTTFSSFVKDVQKGNVTVSSGLYQFLSWFGQKSYEAVKELATDIFQKACYIYNNTSVTEFYNYFKTIKLTTVSASLSILKESVQKLNNFDEKLKIVYSRCISEYNDLVIKHVLSNEITKIKSSDLNHILYMLQELASLVGKAKEQYKKELKIKKQKNQQEKKNISIQITNCKNSYNRWSLGGCIAAGVVTVFAGILGGIVTGVTGGVGIGAGFLIFSGAVAGVNVLHQQENKKLDKHIKELNLKLKNINEKITKLKIEEQEIIQKYDEFLSNIDKFKNQIKKIKNQREIKLLMSKECKNINDIALFLAKQNGDDKNENFLKIYCEVLDDLGATSYEKFVQINSKKIEKTFEKLNKKYSNDNKIQNLLGFIEKVIEKNCMDSHLITNYLSPMNIFVNNDTIKEKTWDQVLIEWKFSKYINKFRKYNWIDISKWKTIEKEMLLCFMTKKDVQVFRQKASSV